MDGDGNGWVECGLGHRHWGIHGAAGLLVYALDDAPSPSDPHAAQGLLDQ